VNCVMAGISEPLKGNKVWGGSRSTNSRRQIQNGEAQFSIKEEPKKDSTQEKEIISLAQKTFILQHRGRADGNSGRGWRKGIIEEEKTTEDLN